jgi:ADP-ribose pyrophosphatase YjhB (NUDIX family)
VNPGGHVEFGESLEEEVLRELKEETGIEGRLSDLKYRMLYESVYPTSLDYGMPSHQHVIVFFSLKLPTRAGFYDMKLQIAEVDLAVWVQSDILREILAGQDPDCELEGIQASVKKDTPCRISPIQLIGIAPNEIGEGIGEGHFLALKRYLGI